MITKDQILSTDFCVLVQIYEDTEVKKEPAYFTKLLKETNLSSMQVNKSLDRLYDKIMIDMQIVKTEDGKQTMGFTISENFLPFTEGLYNATENFINEKQASLDAKKNKDIKKPSIEENFENENTNTLTLSKK